MFPEFEDDTSTLLSAEQKELWMSESRWPSGNCSSMFQKTRSYTGKGRKLKSIQFSPGVWENLCSWEHQVLLKVRVTSVQQQEFFNLIMVYPNSGTSGNGTKKKKINKRGKSSMLSYSKIPMIYCLVKNQGAEWCIWDATFVKKYICICLWYYYL